MEEGGRSSLSIGSGANREAMEIVSEDVTPEFMATRADEVVHDLWHGIERSTREEWLQREYMKLMKEECRLRSESKFHSLKRNHKDKHHQTQPRNQTQTRIDESGSQTRKSEQYSQTGNGDYPLTKSDNDHRDAERQKVPDDSSVPDV